MLSRCAGRKRLFPLCFEQRTALRKLNNDIPLFGDQSNPEMLASQYNIHQNATDVLHFFIAFQRKNGLDRAVFAHVGKDIFPACANESERHISTVTLDRPDGSFLALRTQRFSVADRGSQISYPTCFLTNARPRQSDPAPRSETGYHGNAGRWYFGKSTHFG